MAAQHRTREGFSREGWRQHSRIYLHHHQQPFSLWHMADSGGDVVISRSSAFPRPRCLGTKPPGDCMGLLVVRRCCDVLVWSRHGWVGNTCRRSDAANRETKEDPKGSGRLAGREAFSGCDSREDECNGLTYGKRSSNLVYVAFISLVPIWLITATLACWLEQVG